MLTGRQILNSNQPTKHSIARVGEFKATFSTGLENDER